MKTSAASSILGYVLLFAADGEAAKRSLRSSGVSEIKQSHKHDKLLTVVSWSFVYPYFTLLLQLMLMTNPLCLCRINHGLTVESKNAAKIQNFSSWTCWLTSSETKQAWNSRIWKEQVGTKFFMDQRTEALFKRTRSTRTSIVCHVVLSTN